MEIFSQHRAGYQNMHSCGRQLHQLALENLLDTYSSLDVLHLGCSLDQF